MSHGAKSAHGYMSARWRNTRHQGNKSQRVRERRRFSPLLLFKLIQKLQEIEIKTKNLTKHQQVAAGNEMKKSVHPDGRPLDFYHFLQIQ